MDYRISDRIARVTPSATRAMAEKAAQLKQEGKNVISFSAGEPDFDTPSGAIDYGIEAMNGGKTHYTATAGYGELRQAVADYYEERFQLRYKADEVIIGSGAKPLLYEILGTLINPGDEVIIPTPAWVSYVEQVQLFDGIPRIVDTSTTDFVPSVDAIRSAVTEKTVAIILNSPHNPTGLVFPVEVMKDICALAMEKGFIVINDEIYERITYDGLMYQNPLCAIPEAKDVVVTINGVSKAFAMTGWRIGYAIGPKALIKKMGTFQGHLTSGASSISQWASLGALKNAAKDVERMREEYQRRKEYVVKELRDFPLISYLEPQGAFYAFMDISQTLGKTYNGKTIENDNDFCEILLEEKHVALVPGSAFMAPDHVRMSFAASLGEIQEGMERIKQFLTEINGARS